MGWKGLKQVPQGTAHYHHREGLYHYHHVLVNGPFQLTSSSIILSSHNGLLPAAFLVNDHIHYSSRISVIIDFVQTVCIPQCVLNPSPKRCWTLSHLIRSHESATLRQLLQLLHYMPDNWWPILEFNQRLICISSIDMWLVLQHVHKTIQVWACLACNVWNMLFGSVVKTLCFAGIIWFRKDEWHWVVCIFFVRLPCASPSPLVMTVLFSIPSCKMDLWCMWHLYLPMDVLSLSAPRRSACQSALPRTAWDHSCHNDPTIEKNNLLIFSWPDWNYGCSWNGHQLVFFNWCRTDTKHCFFLRMYLLLFQFILPYFYLLW